MSTSFPNTVLRIDSIDVAISDPVVEGFLTLPEDADVVVILGFAGGDVAPFTPQIVRTVEHALAAFGALDSDGRPTCELAKMLMTCWHAGGRNVILIKTGELDELANLSDDARMQLIYDRTQVGLEVATGLDYTGIVLPADGTFEGYTKQDGTRLDFVAQLADACVEALNNDLFVQGILSSAGSEPTVLVTEKTLVDKYIWQNEYCRTEAGWLPWNDRYRFVSVAAGQFYFNLQRFGTSFQAGMAGVTAGLMSSLPEDMSIMGRAIRGIVPTRVPLKAEADALAMNGLIAFGLTTVAKRQHTPEVVALADQNMGVHLSDYQQNQTLRLTRRITMSVRRQLQDVIGTAGKALDQKLNAGIKKFYNNGSLKTFGYKIARDPADPYRLRVLIEIEPYFSTKVIRIALSVGPMAA